MSKQNTLKQKKERRIEKQLMAYSLAAGAALIAGQSSNAEIIYTDLSPGVTLNTLDQTLDINFGGGPAEFRIEFGQVVATGTYTGAGIVREAVGGSWLGGNNFVNPPLALSYGDSVATGTAWGGRGNFLPALGHFWVGHSVRGNFPGTSDKYVGVKFVIGANTNYGWIQVQMPADPTVSVTITGYAYNNVADDAIYAGQTVPEAGSLGLLALGAAGLTAWRKKRS